MVERRPDQRRALARRGAQADPGADAHRDGLLVLDEPTNHLDLPSIEALEQALAAFGGALLLVTHNDAFARATTDLVWQVADGRVTPGHDEVSPQ